jgi:hypothetical protein
MVPFPLPLGVNANLPELLLSESDADIASKLWDFWRFVSVLSVFRGRSRLDANLMGYALLVTTDPS